MKKKQRPIPRPHDTPATRKRRLLQRLQELNDRSERELAALMKSVKRVKSAYHAQKRRRTVSGG